MIGARTHRDEKALFPVVTYGPTHNTHHYDKDTMVVTVTIDIGFDWGVFVEQVGISYPAHDPDPYDYFGELVLYPEDPVKLCP